MQFISIIVLVLGTSAASAFTYAAYAHSSWFHLLLAGLCIATMVNVWSVVELRKQIADLKALLTRHDDA